MNFWRNCVVVVQKSSVFCLFFFYSSKKSFFWLLMIFSVHFSLIFLAYLCMSESEFDLVTSLDRGSTYFLLGRIDSLCLAAALSSRSPMWPTSKSASIFDFLQFISSSFLFLISSCLYHFFSILIKLFVTWSMLFSSMISHDDSSDDYFHALALSYYFLFVFR